MRLSCHLLKSIVDEYVSRTTDIPIVRRIQISDKQLGGANAWLCIPKRRTALFELRLTLLQPALKYSIHRSFNVLPEYPSQYCVEITSLPDDVMDDLRSCLGTTILATSLPHYSQELIESVLKLVDGIKLEQLELFIDLSVAGAGERLLENLRANRVDELFLTVREASLPHPAEFLLDLSSLVRTLSIDQIYIDGRDLNLRHFLGIDDFNWAPVFIGMFERRLDKLRIKNSYCGFLTLQSADDIRLRLPLLGKKIWFEMRCNAFDQYEDRLDYVTNDHSVKAVRWKDFQGGLGIKHCSRESEKLEI
ncbi:hypothetical protein PRIPAC_78055 [Pristionchus pacificus]|nr:hypothetical protein PRIPAC_78055 [Pristionchus pacificus]